MIRKLSRRQLRTAHLLEGVWLAGYVYTPLGDPGIFRLLTRLFVVPAIVATGLLMWKLPALRARSRTRLSDPTT